MILVLDFDGTAIEKDIGDELCERFADPSWRDAVGRCDELYAVRGGLLDRHCEAQGAPVTRFQRFDEIVARLG